MRSCRSFWKAVVTLSVPAVTGVVLVAGFVVALMSSVVPYSLELEALRRIPPRVFGILMSLEPAVAALAGLVLLGEQLKPAQWVAVCCVVIASVGATRSARPEA